MHRIVDMEGGVYLDGDALAGAGLRPGQRVYIGIEQGAIVLRSDAPMVRLAPQGALQIDAVSH